MNAEDIRKAFLDNINPDYQTKFGWAPAINRYNVSSLTHGAKAFLYYRAQNEKRLIRQLKELRHLIRGSMVDAYAKSLFEPCIQDAHMIKWTLPYVWSDKQSASNITLIGHYDILRDDTIFEVKAPLFREDGSTSFTENGSMIRAVRQAGCYARMQTILRGKYTGGAVVLVDESKLVQGAPIEEILPIIRVLSPEEILDGWNFVKNTAYEVARELNK